MKYIIRWLLPAITVLTILSAALLPEKLSQFRDQKLFHAIHAEEISSNSSLPIWTPDLIQKLSLLYLHNNNPDGNITIINRSLNDSESTPEERRIMEELLYTELNSLVEAQILPKDLFSKNYHLSSALRFYVQDNQENKGNWFLSVELYDETLNYWGASIILDEETGKLLHLSLFSSENLPPISPEIMGQTFLDRLGIEYEPFKKDGAYTIFPLKETNLQYTILLEPETLFITIYYNYHPNTQSTQTDRG